MQRISGIDELQANNGALNDLPTPWNHLLQDFADSGENHTFRLQTTINNEPATFNLHKAEVAYPIGDATQSQGQVILVEDRTSIDLLESELAHSERLASIGRLSAGVAHEIGNPLTGIASVAQNLRYDNGKDEISESASDILGQVERINSIVKSLLTFSRSDSSIGSERALIDLRACIHEALRLVNLGLSLIHI